jgi:hypothetical protein
MGWQPGPGGGTGASPGRDPGMPGGTSPPVRDPRLAGFASVDGRDAVVPSGGLALLADEVSGPERRCPGATGDELVGLLRAWAAIESWAAGAKLGVIAELIRREDAPLTGGYHGDLPDEWSPSLRHELAVALACSAQSAETAAWLAWEQQARLPGVGALLTGGTLTHAKARAITETFRYLTDGDAARAEALILDQLTGKTYTQVLRLAERAALTVDPGLAERRREQAQRKDARVTLLREQSGTAALSGRDLPPDEALAAMASVNVRAEQYKDSDVFGDTRMDVLRAYAYLDLLNGRTAETRIAYAEPQDETAEAAEALAWAVAKAARAAAEARVTRAAAEARAGNGAESEASAAAESSTGAESEAGSGSGTPPAPDEDAPDTAGNPDDDDDVQAGPCDCSCGECDGGCLEGDCREASADSSGRDGDADDCDDDTRNLGRFGYGDDDDEPDDSGNPDDSGGGGPDPGAPGPRPGLPAGQALQSRPADLVVPLTTLLGLAERPGEVQGFGLLDPALARELAAAAAASPRTEVCVTVTSPDGYAIGHGCARPDRGPRSSQAAISPGTFSAELPARLNLTFPAAALPGLAGHNRHPGPWAFTPRGSPGPLDRTDPPDGYGTWTLTLPGGRRLTVRLDPVPVFECFDHRYETHRYQPSDRLRHLIQVRDGTCTFPPCSRHARESDFEHATPYEKGGKTCACNAGARSRACHRVKQSKGWSVTQTRPGWHQWQTPTGRIYVQEPKRYSA